MKDVVMRHRSLFLRIFVAMLGGVMSVLGHELFHVFMHVGQIKSATLFPGNGAIFEMTIVSSTTYDAFGEEMAAYFITAGVLIVTAIIIARMHDKRDARSVRTVVFKEEASMHELSPTDIAQLAYRAGIL